MRKKTNSKPLAVAIGAAMVASMAMADDGVEYHGYVRAQVGGGSKGGNLTCFQLANSPTKYRLGNECDNYAESSIALPFGDTNGVWAKYKLTLALQNAGAFDAESTQGAGSKFNLLQRENYVSMGGFFGGGALENSSVWVGQRFFNRHDVHMIDYYYWSNSGIGSGIEEIKAGPVKLAASYFQSGGNATGYSGIDPKQVVSKRYSLRFYDINTNENGKLEGELVGMRGSSADPSAKKVDGNGTILFLEHTQSGVLGGFNKIAYVHGSGAGGTGFAWLPTYANGTDGSNKANRLTDNFYFNLPGTNWSGLATVNYGKINATASNPIPWKFVNFGIRPQYNFNKNLSVAVEASHDRASSSWVANGKTAELTKFTLAAQAALAPGVWARPVVRAYVTRAKWNDAARDAGIAGGVFGNANRGTTMGVQGEIWW